MDAQDKASTGQDAPPEHDTPADKLARAIDTEREREDGARPEPDTLPDAVSQGDDADG